MHANAATATALAATFDQPKGRLNTTFDMANTSQRYVYELLIRILAMHFSKNFMNFRSCKIIAFPLKAFYSECFFYFGKM